VPPIIGFASIGYKDTVRNIEQTGEFVWNLVTRPLVEPMNQSCAAVPPEVNEFELAGLSALPSRRVRLPRVAESPVHFECRLSQLIPLQSAAGEPLPTWLVLGEVVAVHIDAACCATACSTRGGRPRAARWRPGRYFSIGPEQLFRPHRPR
jgi:flavin reductase (DIM6/NTAB) family NADH-FMN oxidoreductase RutF